MRDREAALALLAEYNTGDYRFFHAKSVEGGMRRFAELKGEDVDYWGVVGLLHDIDFEFAPGAHCQKNPELLAAAGYDDAFIHAVQSHGWGGNTDAEPVLFMEKVLYTLNELVSLVSDSAFSLPSKSIYDLTPEKVVEMFPVEGFAPLARRSTITKGCEMLGMSLEDVSRETITGMAAMADDLGLAGNQIN